MTISFTIQNFKIMFAKKLKRRIQSLEAQVRGLADENLQLQVVANEAKLRAESLRKAVDMYRSQLPLRDERGRFVKREAI